MQNSHPTVALASSLGFRVLSFKSGPRHSSLDVVLCKRQILYLINNGEAA